MSKLLIINKVWKSKCFADCGSMRRAAFALKWAELPCTEALIR